MNQDSDPGLQTAVHAELKQLPPLKAPASLVPNVLRLVAAKARLPWWRLSWWDWPVAAKASFLLFALSLVAAVSQGGVLVNQGIADYSLQVSERLGPAASLLETAQTLLGAAALVWEKTAQPLLFVVLVGVGAFCLVGAGLGTAWFRFALKRPVTVS